MGRPFREVVEHALRYPLQALSMRHGNNCICGLPHAQTMKRNTLHAF